jgi:hypothetical protein
VGVLVTCGFQSIAFLPTGNLVAPIVPTSSGTVR